VTSATCERCGSKDVRLKRTRGLLNRAWQVVSGRQRYACTACHHRGWSDGPVPDAPMGAGRTAPLNGSPLPGRPLEHRDLRATRQARADRLLAITVALGLGALLAGLIAWAVS